MSHVFATLKIPVRSLTSYLRRKTASFSICSIINHCSACGDVSSFTRGLTLSFGSDISAKFGPRLFEAFMCHESNIVDSSFIIAMYKALVYAASAYRNPRSIFLNLLEEYTSSNGDTRCDYKKLGDVLKIVSIAAVTNSEVGRTSGLLQDQLTKTCGGGSTRLTIVELEKALDSCPSIMDHFRLQLVNQMPSDDKIELLCALENESLGAFIEASKAIGIKRMHAFKMRSLLRCFDAWRMEVQLSHRVTKRRKKTALSAWNKEAQRLKMAKVLKEVSLVTGYTALMRRSFIRWRRLNAVKNRVQRICLSGDIDKEVRSASGHLRVFAKKLKRRLAYSTWISYTLMERRCEDAKHWHERKTVRLAFHVIHRHSILEIQQRKRIREASLIQQRKLQQLQQQSLELERNKDHKRPKWTSKLASPAKSHTRKLSQDDIEILISQRELRRNRVEHKKLEMEKAMNTKWLAKQSEFETSLMRRIEAWKSSADYKRLFEDQELKYRRMLSDAIDEDTERALSSDDVISYSILDGLMVNSLVDPELFFKSLPDPFDIFAFERALDGVNFNTFEVESLFEGMAGLSKSMTKGRLRELQSLSHQYVGEEGSLWKIYACSSRIQFHNISSGQTITAIKKKHIRQAVRENLHSCEILKARRTFAEMKQQAYRSMWEQHAAKTIQYMYRLWKGRHQVKRKLWIVDRLRLKKRAKETKAARVIQDAFRRRIERDSKEDKLISM